MAVFWFQIIPGLLQRLCRRLVCGYQLLVAAFDIFGKVEYNPKNENVWIQLLFILAYTLEFPMTVFFHPLVSQQNVNDWKLCPSLPHLLSQLTIFLIIDRVCRRFFTHFYATIVHDESPGDDRSSAVEIATDFTTYRTTLCLAISAIQILAKQKCLSDGLHFAAILCWLLVR